MTRLADIPVRVEPLRVESVRVALDATANGLGGGMAALLSELAKCLDRLSTTNECATIDLRSLPLSPADRTSLQHVLGNGEVTATLDAAGKSTLRETRFSGLWWVEHRNRDGEMVADLLEVTRIPAILASAPDEISAAAQELKLRIRAEKFAGVRVSHA